MKEMWRNRVKKQKEVQMRREKREKLIESFEKSERGDINFNGKNLLI